MSAKWKYIGDRDLQCGGVFISVDANDTQYGYASAIRVIPASDAGLPDNQFWVEWVTVNGLDDNKRVTTALESCGWTSDNPGMMEKIDALMCYGYYDVNHSEVIQLGAEVDPFYSGRDEPLKPTIILRTNASLRNWVKRNYWKD